MARGAQAKRDTAGSTTPAFEEILSKLGSVVEQLESGDMSLEDSLVLFEEGVRLSRMGATRLSQAEQRIERLLSDDGSTQLIEVTEKENETP